MLKGRRSFVEQLRGDQRSDERDDAVTSKSTRSPFAGNRAPGSAGPHPRPARRGDVLALEQPETLGYMQRCLVNSCGRSMLVEEQAIRAVLAG
jgi:hypothetical protein